MKNRKARIISAPLLIAFALLAGCTQEQLHNTPEENLVHFEGEVDAFFNHGEWRQTPAPLEPYAETIALEHQLVYRPGNVQLSDGNRADLHGFLRDKQVKDGEAIVLDGPRGPDGAHDVLTAARLENLRQELARSGLSAQVASAAPSSQGNVPKDQVAISVSRTFLLTPDCARAQPDKWQRADYTWTCATASNLGHMLADPNDLNGTNQPGVADGTTNAASVNRYRASGTKAIKIESTQ